ncbi:MAG: NAD(P)-dependent oxidoreductase [Pirellulales bacterium]
MKALITGISGFVGSHLAEHLLAAGDAVLGATRDGDRPEFLAGEVGIVAWDMATHDASGAIFDAVQTFAPDVIYHLAAMSIPQDCGTAEPSAMAEALNVGGVRRVLELAEKLAKRPRVVFTSSSHVYAVEPSRMIVAETAPLLPRNAYGRTKLAAEQLCETAVRGGTDVVVVRSFAQAGPRQDPRLMLAEWARQFAGNESEIHVGNLHVTVDVVDVHDSVRALRVLALEGESGAIYNVGSGRATTTGELFQLLRSAAGDERPVVERDQTPRFDPIADVSKLTARTGWRPAVSSAEMVASVWEYWRARATSEQPQQQQQQ